MRGAETLTKYRLAGNEVSDVWVWVGDTPKLSFVDDWFVYGLPPEVIVLPGDRIEMLDFRWCLGLVVHIDGQDIRRVAKVHREITKAGARLVYSLIGDDLLYNKGEKVAYPGRRQG